MRGKKVKEIRKFVRLMIKQSGQDLPQILYERHERPRFAKILNKYGKEERVKLASFYHINMSKNCIRWHYQKLKSLYKKFKQLGVVV